ncbi:hypothetical protein ES703_89580 [subsurface metagenome]
MFETSPSYIKQLLQPNGNKRQGRRVWSVDLETVWLPFFHATNVMGDTAIPAEALGCPIRLGYDRDGAVKFSKSGRPITKVVKEITQIVTLVRENMVANLLDFTHQVVEGKASQYKVSVTTALKAGKPILDKEKLDLDTAIKAQNDQALREAEAKPDQPAEALPAQTMPPEAKVKEAVTA